MDKQEIIDIYKKYGYELPLVTKYKRSPDRIYFVDDFKDGEEIELCWNCTQPSACAIGNVFYKNKNGNIKLVNVKELNM